MLLAADTMILSGRHLLYDVQSRTSRPQLHPNMYHHTLPAWRMRIHQDPRDDRETLGFPYRLFHQGWQIHHDRGRMSWGLRQCTKYVRLPRLTARIHTDRRWTAVMQIGDEFYEDLTPETTIKVLDALAKGEKPKPGPQSGRRTSENAAGLTSLTSKVRSPRGVYLPADAFRCVAIWAGRALSTRVCLVRINALSDRHGSSQWH